MTTTSRASHPKRQGQERPPLASEAWRARLGQPGWVVLPLRLFLGVTFVYAGMLKLVDPTYLDANAPQSVQQQMAIQARTSPIGGLVGVTAHHAVLFGLAIAVGELAVGVGTLLGIWSRLSAAGGFLLATSFFLTVSFHTHPYFFGSDIVFMFGWVTLALAGDGGVLSLGAAIRRSVRLGMGLAPTETGRESARVAAEVDRRTLLQTGAAAGLVGAATLLVGGVAGWLSRRGYTPAKASAAPTPSPTGTPHPTPTADASPSPTSNGTAVMKAARVPVGGAVSFSDPKTGEPAYVVQPTAGHYEAFSAICTHAGCPVGFDGTQFACPCHGATYSATTGAVTGGPAPLPLSKIDIQVSGGTVEVV